MKRRQLIPLFLAGLIVSLLSALFSALLNALLSACMREPPGFVANVLSGDSPPTTTLIVSAASSLQDALEAIAPQFSITHPSITIQYNFGASGALQQQIQQGAPADIFFSAASQQMDALAEAEMILPGSRQNIVANELVLIAPLETEIAIADFAELRDIDIQRFAVGEFRSVPAGQYAKQVLEALDLLSALQSKFIFGNNVRAVLSAVESGNADLGMVYATDAALSKRVTILATVPANSHAPIHYPIAIVKETATPEAAQTFIDFLTTEAAQQTFADFGFGRS